MCYDDRVMMAESGRGECRERDEMNSNRPML
jgi:hypothetical protein